MKSDEMSTNPMIFLAQTLLMFRSRGEICYVGTGTVDGSDVGFLVIFPVIGLLTFVFLVVCVVRLLTSGGHFVCRGPHDHDSEKTTRLRQEIEECVNN